MDDADPDFDPHREIERLEARIEQLADRIEGCRKFILAGRVAVVAGGVSFVAMLFGVIRFDPTVMTACIAAVLGGIVAWGSNVSTAQEAAKDLAAAEVDRAALIGQLELRTLH